jgi:hypothetical protein
VDTYPGGMVSKHTYSPNRILMELLIIDIRFISLNQHLVIAKFIPSNLFLSLHACDVSYHAEIQLVPGGDHFFKNHNQPPPMMSLCSN